MEGQEGLNNNTIQNDLICSSPLGEEENSRLFVLMGDDSLVMKSTTGGLWFQGGGFRRESKERDEILCGNKYFIIHFCPLVVRYLLSRDVGQKLFHERADEWPTRTLAAHKIKVK